MNESENQDPEEVSDDAQKEAQTVPEQFEVQVEEPPVEIKGPCKLRKICAWPPQGIFATIITNVSAGVLFWAVIWSIARDDCLPGGNLFGLVFLYLFSLLGGKFMALIHIPHLPPLPRLFGMLLAGFLIRNIPFTSKIVKINVQWGAVLRNIALSIILALAGLGLNPEYLETSEGGSLSEKQHSGNNDVSSLPTALYKLKAVCLRLSLGPCIIESCAAAVISHFIMGLPWEWAFMLGFVLGAVSPAIVVLSMLGLQARGYGVDKGIPTLLIAAGSVDDIVAITGFNTFLGMAFSSGSTIKSLLHGVMEIAIGIGAGVVLGIFIWYFPSRDQIALAWKRTFFVMGLSAFSLLGSRIFNIHGSGGLCTIIFAFLGGLAWGDEKKAVEEKVSVAWHIFQPFLFGLIGAEISVISLGVKMVGLCLATLGLALAVRVIATFLMATAAGFDFKEKLFIALAWIPKATVQAAIGSVALDTARLHNNEQLQQYGLSILTVAFLAILITAPTGALIIGLTGPKLLHKTSGSDSVEDRTQKGKKLRSPV